MSWGGFAHGGPLHPVDIPQQRWAEHPVLRWALETADGTVNWDLPPTKKWTERKQAAELVNITFKIDEQGHRVAHVPPRLNHDWFVDAEADEQAPAPVLGRERDITRWYVREDEFTGWHGSVCAQTVEEVRRYFEWLADGVWVQVPLSRWLSIRTEGLLDEVKDQAFKHSHPVPYAAPRTARTMADAQLTQADAVAQTAIAQAIASIAHRGQTDKNGERYINHPARVASAIDGDDEPVARAAAWLHDVLEDTELAVRDLLEAGVLPQVLEVVALLTRDAAVPDEEYYERIRTNPTALRVKAADIADNTAAWRFRLLDEPTRARLARKYEHARAELGLTDEN